MLLIANIFQPLIDVFEAVIKFFHHTVGVPWGFSIVLLTVTIRALLLPLTLKQVNSMRAMRELQPQLKELQKKYKDDKSRQQQELMKLYKENNVNPLGSCLPIVAQLPVFISLYYMLRSNLRADICPAVQKAFAAAHGVGKTTPCGVHHGDPGFLFIGDLTDKATGIVLIVLIVLYVGTQLGSSMMMMSTSPAMDKKQQRLMLFLPVVFVFVIIGFPSGVILYWITTNTWTILQQYLIFKRIGPAPPMPKSADDDGGLFGGLISRASGGGSSSAAAAPSGNGRGNGSSAAAGAVRGKRKEAPEKKEKETVAASPRPRGGPPPRSPRKKKKRSGRRR